VPAQKGLRRDEQTMAAPGREQAACRGEEGAVTRSQRWARGFGTLQAIFRVDETVS
jgi:hypothetical protein